MFLRRLVVIISFQNIPGVVDLYVDVSRCIHVWRFISDFFSAASAGSRF